MTDFQKKEISKGLRYWLCSFVFVAGFLYYHSRVPLGPLLIAGVLTFLLVVFQAYRRTPPLN